MLDLGWQELVIIGIVTIVVVGPKDLPRIIRGVRNAYRTIRFYVDQGRSSVQDMMREVDINAFKDDLKNQISDPLSEVRGQVGVDQIIKSVGSDISKSMEQTIKPSNQSQDIDGDKQESKVDNEHERALGQRKKKDHSAKSNTPKVLESDKAEIQDSGEKNSNKKPPSSAKKPKIKSNKKITTAKT